MGRRVQLAAPPALIVTGRTRSGSISDSLVHPSIPLRSTPCLRTPAGAGTCRAHPRSQRSEPPRSRAGRHTHKEVSTMAQDIRTPRKRRLVSLAIGAVAAALLTVGPVSAQGTPFVGCPTWTADGSGLIYCSGSDGYAEIFEIAPDGNVRQLTFLGGQASAPAVSPDGSTDRVRGHACEPGCSAGLCHPAGRAAWSHRDGRLFDRRPPRRTGGHADDPTGPTMTRPSSRTAGASTSRATAPASPASGR